MRKWILFGLLAGFLSGGPASAQPKVTAFDHCTAALAAVGYAGSYQAMAFWFKLPEELATSPLSVNNALEAVKSLSCSGSLATRIYQCSVTEYARLAMDWQGANAGALHKADLLQRREMGMALVEPSVKGCRILWGEAD